MEDKEIELIVIPDDEIMLTTIDNPFNPKEDYNKWRNWDIEHAYFTEQLLERSINIPPNVDDPVSIDAIALAAMLDIADNDELGLYKLI